ncbi:hypothetical protein CRUP_014526 [Coryphaenoides rupestris]|nr:hypothetical protein CRUP_014526 [Coryphaenoides rupestris]
MAPPSTNQKKKSEKDHNKNGSAAAADKKKSSSPTEPPCSRPRPLSLRAKPQTWALLRGRNKSYSLGHYSGHKSAQALTVMLGPEGPAVSGCSLLDMDTEGQKRDCTVPLCRIQSSPGRPSVFELEKEFLS